MDKMRLLNEYPPNTIGYHYLHAKAFFGAETRPCKWLEEKAKESPNGWMEGVVAHETQVVQLLGEMWLKEKSGQ